MLKAASGLEASWAGGVQTAWRPRRVACEARESPGALSLLCGCARVEPTKHGGGGLERSHLPVCTPHARAASVVGYAEEGVSRVGRLLATSRLCEGRVATWEPSSASASSGLDTTAGSISPVISPVSAACVQDGLLWLPWLRVPRSGARTRLAPLPRLLALTGTALLGLEVSGEQPFLVLSHVGVVLLHRSLVLLLRGEREAAAPATHPRRR
jgi:hypothetical protein